MHITKEVFQTNVGLAAEIIKTTLETFNMYIAVDSKTKEFIFIDRDSYENRNLTPLVAKVHMEEINVKNTQKI